MPVRVVFAGVSNYVISGPESVAAYFKESRDLSNSTRNVIIMEKAFGCPRHLLHQFQSGAADQNSNDISVQVDQLIHKSVNMGLAGQDLEAVTTHFQEHYTEHLMQSAAELGNDWVQCEDICSLVEDHVFESAAHALFGPFMLSLNPNLARDFWAFNKYFRPLVVGVPRWLSPAAYKARDTMVESIKRWQRHASLHYTPEELGGVDWEPLWGSKVVRERQVLLTRRRIVDETARAAENLAIMWAFNANSVTASVWMLLQSAQDTALAMRVCQCIQTTVINYSSDASHTPHFDLGKLLSDDLLQSIYAETLRVRFAALVIRQPTTDNFSFRGWHIKKHEVLSLSTYNQAMDPTVWNSGGPNDPHPLMSFWSDRFIVKPDDADSGPLKGPRRRSQHRRDDKPYFSMEGLASSWIPYGGGRSHCPGRHFAKREMMLTTALFLHTLDIEITTMPEMDLRLFGFGSVPIKGKVPCRIRRRQMPLR